MPVTLVKRVVKGWKQDLNGRFGECVVVQFKDGDRVLFEYAPTLEEKEFWGFLFQDVYEIDELHKRLINLYDRVDPTWSGRYLKKTGCGNES